MSNPAQNSGTDKPLLGYNRSYTTGGKLGARQMFVFNEDGTIAGLQQVAAKSPQITKQGQGSPKSSVKDKKFGRLSSKMSVSAMSVAESKVAFSDANYMPKEGQPEGARIGKMRGKPGVTIWNLLLVPGCTLFSMLSGADVMQSMAQIVKAEDYYNLPHDKADKVTANSLAYAQLVAIPTILVIGILFDLLGRQKIIASTFVLGAVATQLVPIVAPSVAAYDVCRVVYCQTLVIALANPFINDYVTVQSRGIATGFQMIGLTAGNLISIGGLFTLTESLANKTLAYGILAALQLLWAVLLYLMITEPDIRNEKEERHKNKKGFCGQLFSMLKQAYKACMQDSALLISLIALIPSRNTATLQQSNFYIWIASDKFGLGPDEAKSVWQTQNIISNLCALPIVFLVGRLTDRVSPKILVPGVLIYQMIVMVAYMFCHHPAGWYAYVLAAFQGGSGFAIIVVMQGYAAKRVPKMIRGIVMALIISLSGVGSIIYLSASKPFFKEEPNMVFGLIGLFDGAVLILILAGIACGKYGDAAPQEDAFGEGNSQKNEKTADFVKDHEFDDDIPDLPFNKDLYDEHIPEMSSFQEASASFHTKKYLQKSVLSGQVYDEMSRSESQDIVGSIKPTVMQVRASQQNGTLISEQNQYLPVASQVGLTGDDMMSSFQHRKNSTLNKSDSDDGVQQSKLLNQRATHVPRSHFNQNIASDVSNNQDPYADQQQRQSRFTKEPISVTRGTGTLKRKTKRSSSFEQSRPTILQELLQGAIIQEEKKEESDDEW